MTTLLMNKRTATLAAASMADAVPEEIPVESSLLKSVRYDERAQILELTFDNDRVYHYLDVPEPVKEELIAAPSKGQFFNERIRSRYGFRRIR